MEIYCILVAHGEEEEDEREIHLNTRTFSINSPVLKRR